MGKIDKGVQSGISSQNTRFDRIKVAAPSLCPAGDIAESVNRLSGEKARQTETAAPVPEITLGGLRIAAVDRQMAAALLISAVGTPTGVAVPARSRRKAGERQRCVCHCRRGAPRVRFCACAG